MSQNVGSTSLVDHSTRQSGVPHNPGVGSAAPLGASVTDGGVNFSVFSRRATSIDLLLFDRVDDLKPARVIRLDPAASRTYHYWHVLVPDLTPGQIYGFRAHGPFD